MIFTILKLLNNDNSNFKQLSDGIEFLKRSIELKWDLINQPLRLKINTIDSLCQSISQAIPLQEKHIPFADLDENIDKYFQEAANNTIEFALDNEAYHQAIKTILLHLDL